MLLWWHLLVLVILLFGDESFVVIGRHRARVVWLERAQRGGCGSAALQGRGAIRAVAKWSPRSGPSLVGKRSRAPLREKARERDRARSRPCCSGGRRELFCCPACCPGRSLVGQSGKQVASTWPPGLVPLAPSLLGTPFSSFYYASPPLREREREGERPRPTDRLIVRVCVCGGTRTVCERAFKEWSFLALTYCNGANIN